MSVAGSKVIIETFEIHRILLYRPRHECFMTKYRARYSCSSGEWGKGRFEAEVEVKADDVAGSAWRLTKSICCRYARVSVRGGLGRRKNHSPEPGASPGRDRFAPSSLSYKQIIKYRSLPNKILHISSNTTNKKLVFNLLEINKLNSNQNPAFCFLGNNLSNKISTKQNPFSLCSKPSNKKLIFNLIPNKQTQFNCSILLLWRQLIKHELP